MDKNGSQQAYHSPLLAVKPFLHPGESAAGGDDLHAVAITRVQEADAALGDRFKVLYERRLKADLADDVTWDRDVIPDTHAIAKVFNSRIKSVFRTSGPSP